MCWTDTTRCRWFTRQQRYGITERWIIIGTVRSWFSQRTFRSTSRSTFGWRWCRWDSGIRYTRKWLNSIDYAYDPFGHLYFAVLIYSIRQGWHPIRPREFLLNLPLKSDMNWCVRMMCDCLVVVEELFVWYWGSLDPEKRIEKKLINISKVGSVSIIKCILARSVCSCKKRKCYLLGHYH